MRNFQTVSTLTTKVFTGPYPEALIKARDLNKENKATNVSYTIDGPEDGEGVVTKHEYWGGKGNVPYQPDAYYPDADPVKQDAEVEAE